MSLPRRIVASSPRAIILAAALVSLGACSSSVLQSGDIGRTTWTPDGDVLISSAGDTLYTYDKDTPGHSNCTGLCAANWPPAEPEAGAKPSGDFTIITRPSGTRQWAYKGKPLYSYRLDGGPNSTSGDNVDGVWHIAKP